MKEQKEKSVKREIRWGREVNPMKHVPCCVTVLGMLAHYS